MDPDVISAGHTIERWHSARSGALLHAIYVNEERFPIRNECNVAPFCLLHSGLGSDRNSGPLRVRNASIQSDHEPAARENCLLSAKLLRVDPCSKGERRAGGHRQRSAAINRQGALPRKPSSPADNAGFLNARRGNFGGI